MIMQKHFSFISVISSMYYFKANYVINSMKEKIDLMMLFQELHVLKNGHHSIVSSSSIKKSANILFS